MPIEIRTPSDDQIPEAYRVFTTALQFPAPSPDDLERRRSGWYADRAVVALDRGRIVGHVGALPLETTVPGGRRLPTAGLSRVGVLPSHRRRGILTRMMHTHLTEAAARGEVLASLRASEARIYGRFGYGVAGLAADVRLDRRRAAFRREPDSMGSIRLLEPTELLDELPPAYDRCRWRVGAISRPQPLWEGRYRHVLDPAAPKAQWAAVHEDAAGRSNGLVTWKSDETTDFWEHGTTVQVLDLFGASAEVEATLWRFVLDLDLSRVVTCEGRPLDESVRWWLEDSRMFWTTAVWDEQWLRLLDVDAALAARTYAGETTVVIEVTEDCQLPANVGRFEVGPHGCRRVRRRPDLTADVAALGAAYLGGTSWTELTAAHRVEEHRRGAAARADVAFTARPLPWCGTFF